MVSENINVRMLKCVYVCSWTIKKKSPDQKQKPQKNDYTVV